FGLAVLQVLLEGLLGFLVLFVLGVQDAEVVVGARVPGVARDRLVVLGDGLVGVALAAIDRGQAEVVLGRVGLEGDRFLERRDGAVHVCRLLLGDAQAVPGAGIVGFEGGGLGELLDRALVVALALV